MAGRGRAGSGDWADLESDGGEREELFGDILVQVTIAAWKMKNEW